MPARIFYLAAALLLLVAATSVAAAGRPAPIYAFDQAFPPFTFVENGQAKGFELDVLRRALEGSGFEPRLSPGQWGAIQKELSQGDVNISSGAAKTDERLKKYIYAESPTSTIEVRIFTKTDSPIRCRQDLGGRRVATQKGSLYHQLLEKQGGMELVLCPTEPAALAELAAGKADAAVIAGKTGYYYIKKEAYQGISAVGTPLERTAIYFIFAKKDQALADAVSRGLKRMLLDGSYERIYRGWFVSPVSQAQYKALVEEARTAMRMAYAPYSRFQVGAAVLCGSGRIYAGCNVENSLLNLCSTAVNTAVVKAVSNGETDIRALVNLAMDGRHLAPAVTDRQLVYEFNRGAQVLTPGGGTDGFESRTIAEILPMPFDLQ